jgi:GGDEF domain-containing protein
MHTVEIVIWSAMLGGLLTLATAAMVDVVMNRNVASSWRGLVFLLLTGTSCIVLSGLPAELFPGLPPSAALILKCSLSPLSGALALTYLGLWMGVAAEDPWVHHTITWGSAASVAAAVGMATLSALYAAERERELLELSALVSSMSIALALLASVRAAQLGDRLARWMVLACVFLAGSIAGLYAKALQFALLTPKWIGLTAFCVVAFFLVVLALGIQRSRQQRRLERLSGLSQGSDTVTGLPTGSVLLSKVGDAMWRSARINTDCAIICIYLRNLYELGETAGHGVDHQILVSMAARVRRAVGFRCVVGLYHPRCFIVVISAVKQPALIRRMEQRLSYLCAKPLSVVGLDHANHGFTPQVGMGTVMALASSADPAAVMDEAERLAQTVEDDPSDRVTTADSLTPSSFQ